MLLNTPLNIQPVFPQITFRGNLQLTEHEITPVLQEINKLVGENTHYGYVTQPGKYGSSTLGIIKIGGSLFHESASTYFGLNATQQQKIESVEHHFVTVNPGMASDTFFDPPRWYRCAVMLHGDERVDHSIRLHMPGAQSIGTPPQSGIKKHVDIVMKPMDVLFWPGYIPWSIRPNEGKQPSAWFINHYIIKS